MKAGDWVETKLGSKVYIDAINGSLARIGKFYKMFGEYKTKIELVQTANLVPAKLEGYSEEEIDFLINLALDTNDRKWFDELLARKKQLEKTI